MVVASFFHNEAIFYFYFCNVVFVFYMEETKKNMIKSCKYISNVFLSVFVHGEKNMIQSCKYISKVFFSFFLYMEKEK